MKHWKEERMMQVPVPEALLPVAEELEALLQKLADSLSIYAHLAPKDDSREAAAMVLFQQWLEQRDAAAKRLQPLHQLYVGEMLSLAHSPLSPVQRFVAGQELLNLWYQAACLYTPAIQQQYGDELQCLRLRLTPDVLMLQRLFHFDIEDFLVFYIQLLSAEPTTGVAEKSRQLALHFFVQD